MTNLKQISIKQTIYKTKDNQFHEYNHYICINYVRNTDDNRYKKAISSIVKNEESIPNSGNSTTLHKIRRMKKITRQNRKNKIRKLSEQLNQILEQLNAVNLFEICIIDTYIMIIFVELIVLCLVYCLFNTYLFKIGHTCTYYKHCAHIGLYFTVYQIYNVPYWYVA
jgi:hypothetical protein